MVAKIIMTTLYLFSNIIVVGYNFTKYWRSGLDNFYSRCLDALPFVILSTIVLVIFYDVYGEE